MTNQMCMLCQNRLNFQLDFDLLFLAKKLVKHPICPTCQSKFDRVKREETCKGCNSKKTDQLCDDCQAWQAFYPHLATNHRALYHYNDFAKEWMELYKVKGHSLLAQGFAQEIKATIADEFSQALIIPIPSSTKSFRQRKFNQVHHLLDMAQVEYADILLNHSQGPKQSQKNKGERLRTLQQFHLITEEIRFTGQKIVFFDDIYTTGRTLYHAKELVYGYGARDIHSLSLFR